MPQRFNKPHRRGGGKHGHAFSEDAPSQACRHGFEARCCDEVHRFLCLHVEVDGQFLPLRRPLREHKNIRVGTWTGIPPGRTAKHHDRRRMQQVAVEGAVQERLDPLAVLATAGEREHPVDGWSRPLEVYGSSVHVHGGIHFDVVCKGVSGALALAGARDTAFVNEALQLAQRRGRRAVNGVRNGMEGEGAAAKDFEDR